MESLNPVTEFDSLLSSSKFLFVVYYRGHWCLFCNDYLKSLHTLEPHISTANGTTLIVTSEPESYLSTTRKNTGYEGKTIVDTQNLLAKELKQRGMVEVAISEKKGYANGMAQPAILALKRDGTVLESWACVPSLMNFAGAKDRPDLSQVWENVQAKLVDEKAVYDSYKSQGALGVIFGKVFG